MPHKANAGRRHHIPRPKRRVTNWAAYDAALRRRGSLTIWFTDEALASWRAAPRTTPGGQPHYSALAITTALMLRAVFRLALRQTEGLIGSILRIPTNPAGYSNLKPATCSDMKPAGVPISFRPLFGSEGSRPDGCSWVVVDVRGDVVSGQAGMVGLSAERRLRKLSPASSMR